MNITKILFMMSLILTGASYAQPVHRISQQTLSKVGVLKFDCLKQADQKYYFKAYIVITLNDGTRIRWNTASTKIEGLQIASSISVNMKKPPIKICGSSYIQSKPEI